MENMKTLKYCVNNEWIESKSNDFSPIMNPSTGEQIAQTPMCTMDEVNAAVAAAKAAFPAWSAKPVAVRTQVIFRFRELVNENFEELALMMSTEMGKNLNEAKGDVHKVVEACEVAVSAPMEIQGHSMMEATRSPRYRAEQNANRRICRYCTVQLPSNDSIWLVHSFMYHCW